MTDDASIDRELWSAKAPGWDRHVGEHGDRNRRHAVHPVLFRMLADVSDMRARWLRKRLENLEQIAMDHPGVERCFAIQAGRELRVMVEPEKVSDAEMAQISEAVARKIEDELQYPGQIKVVVVRETRAIDFAR